MTSPYRKLAERFEEVSHKSDRRVPSWVPDVMVFVGTWMQVASYGCSSTQQHHAEAESAYGAELQACVANSSNRVDSDVCADKVRAKWAYDAGTEAGK